MEYRIVGLTTTAPHYPKIETGGGENRFSSIKKYTYTKLLLKKCSKITSKHFLAIFLSISLKFISLNFDFAKLFIEEWLIY